MRTSVTTQMFRILYIHPRVANVTITSEVFASTMLHFSSVIRVMTVSIFQEL